MKSACVLYTNSVGMTAHEDRGGVELPYSRDTWGSTVMPLNPMTQAIRAWTSGLAVYDLLVFNVAFAECFADCCSQASCGPCPESS